MCYVILRCFVSRDRNLLVKAFVVYVWPILEYNSVISSPMLKKDIVCIVVYVWRHPMALAASC